jgi:hypothetical protein
MVSLLCNCKHLVVGRIDFVSRGAGGRHIFYAVTRQSRGCILVSRSAAECHVAFWPD